MQSKSVEPGPYATGLTIPHPDKDVVRIDFYCGMVIRACPSTHPVLAKSKKTYPLNEKKLLLTIKQFVDAKVKYVPLKLINFFTRQVIKQLLGNFLKVAEGVKSGDRPNHQDAINEHRELYDWVETRIKVLFHKFE